MNSSDSELGLITFLKNKPRPLNQSCFSVLETDMFDEYVKGNDEQKEEKEKGLDGSLGFDSRWRHG